jgi:cytochrome P450/NADPH-cytochrome P450 reductase
MEDWAAKGVIDSFVAFSAMPDHRWRFVQNAMWDEQERVWAAIEAGAHIYVCGDGKYMAPAVRDMLIKIAAQQSGGDHDSGSAWLERMIEDGRFHQDVFGFGK